MMRSSDLLWLTVTAAVACGAFLVAYGVRQLEDELDALNREIAATEQAIHVLHAEWSYLNRPERLAALVKRHLQLQPVAGTQVVGIEALPPREGLDKPSPHEDSPVTVAKVDP